MQDLTSCGPGCFRQRVAELGMQHSTIRKGIRHEVWLGRTQLSTEDVAAMPLHDVRLLRRVHLPAT